MKKVILLVIALMNFGCFGQETLKEKETKINLDNEISLLVNIGLFELKKHNVIHCEVSCEDYCIIDGQITFGHDCNAPFTKLNSIKFIHNKERINLNIAGLYNPKLKSLDIDANSFELFSFGDGKFHILTGYFSDGSGAYTVKWLIKNSYSVRISINTL